jgi:hypothetical protein
VEETNVQPVGGRRLVLGFDAGCMTCSGLARRIEETVGDRLEVLSLDDPTMKRWREQTLGKDAAWEPTLIEISKGRTKAWTGLRLGVRLSRCLGPVATWRVMQVLGEDKHGGDSIAGRGTATLESTSLTRGGFIKGALGVTTAVSALLGAGVFSSPASARANVGEWGAKSIGHRDIVGEDLGTVARSVVRREDIVNVMGSSWSRKAQSDRFAKARVNGHDIEVLANDDNPSVRTSEGGVSVSGGGMVVKASKHDLEGENGMLAVVYLADNQIVSYYEFDEPTDGVKSKAEVWEVDQKNGVVVLKNASRNGVLNSPIPHSESKSSSAKSVTCGGCGSSRRRRRVRVCNSISYRCLIINCGICLLGAPGYLKLACVYIYCPFLLYCGAGTCCKSGGCAYACAGCA